MVIDEIYNVSNSYIFLWTLTVCVLIVYNAICASIYLKTRMKPFMHYAAYTFLLVAYLTTKAPYIFEELNQHYYQSRFVSLNWFVQILYHSMLVLFYSEILQLEKSAPVFTKILTKYIKYSISISSLFFLYTVITNTPSLYNSFFHWVHVPVISLVTVFSFYYILKSKNANKWYVVIGLLFYNIFGIVALVESMSDSEEPLRYFFYGILLESTVLMLALAELIKSLYLDTIAVQKLAFETEREKNLLIEAHQAEIVAKLKQQEIELIESQKKHEEEEFKALTSQYEQEIANMRLEALRNQMNPHFIFNALNSIKVYIIENDKEKAVYYLNKFSKLIRIILESSKREEVSLIEELDVLELYMNMENIRFQNAILFDLAVDPNLSLGDVKIPPLILQPFIENALWHGLMLKEGEKKIGLKVYFVDGKTQIEIRDNGIGREKAMRMKEMKGLKRESMGLGFTQERLDNFNKKNKKNYHFEFEDLYANGSPAGTSVKFTLE